MYAALPKEMVVVVAVLQTMHYNQVGISYLIRILLLLLVSWLVIAEDCTIHHESI